MGTMILAAGTHVLAAASTTSKGSNPAFTFLILAVLIGVFYLLVMRPQRNRQRRMAQTQSQVMPGQRVRTTSGMYGTVVSGDDRDVVIEIAPGVHVTMLRRAIMDVISDESPMPETIGDTGNSDSASADDWDFKDSASSQDAEAKDRNS